MKHPNPIIQKRQRDLLLQCPVDEREYFETFLRIGNACYVYNQLAYDTSPAFLEMCYHEWLEILQPKIREAMEEFGFDYCKNMFPFTRYVNECKDVGLKEWLKQHLSAKDFIAFEVAEISYKKKYNSEEKEDTDDFIVASFLQKP